MLISTVHQKFYAFFMFVSIKDTVAIMSLFVFCCTYKINYYLVTFKRSASLLLTDARKHLMFNFISLTYSRKIVTHRNIKIFFTSPNHLDNNQCLIYSSFFSSIETGSFTSGEVSTGSDILVLPISTIITPIIIITRGPIYLK